MRGLTTIIVCLLICKSSVFCGQIHLFMATALTGDADKPYIEDESTRQLRIYSDALIHGVSDGIRLDAAMGLLIRKEQSSHSILLDALSLPDNLPAQMAVCRALIKGRSLGSAVGPIDMFLPALVNVVKSPDIVLSKLAGEALLAFPFNDVCAGLTELAQNKQMDKQTRLNAIYAFQIRPEPEAIRCLVVLLEDSDPEIVRAVELALQESFGTPIGTGNEVWAKVLKELDLKKPADIYRERLLRQETRLRSVQIERDYWQKLYLAAMDKEYESLDANAKATFLQDKLGSDLTPIKMWALDRVQRFTSEAAGIFKDKLLVLLSNESKQVRLATAKTLSTMSALNPAEKLLEQYKQENDPQVALALFEALGEACFFAFSPGSKITLPVEIKTQTLQIADSYTSKSDPEDSKKGAEILRKMLELNGLTQKETEGYLQTILNRYHLETQTKGPIRGDLLMVMARLCAQNNNRTFAAAMYQPIFESVLQSYDDNSQVRQAAAMGMMNIDKAAAMQLFRKVGLQNDASPAVLQVYIDLAGQNGTAEDLEWLYSRFAVDGQGDQVWSAALAILQRQDASVIASWAARVEQNPAISDTTQELLSLAEQKAEAQKDAKVLCETQLRLLQWYASQGQYEQVALYREKLAAADGSNDAFEQALRQTDGLALDAYLQLRKFSAAAQVIGDLLRGNRISSTSDVLDKISIFMASEKTPIEDKRSLLKSLSELTISSDQIWWNDHLERWKSFESATPTANWDVNAP